MSRDEIPFSSHAADQAWFSMLLVNHPNTALVGALRPSRMHPIWAALRRPFERVPGLEPAPSAAVEEIPGLRPRPGRWLGAGLLLVLGIALGGGGLERVRGAAATFTAAAAAQEERVGTTIREARPAPSPERVANVRATSVEAPPGASGAAVQRDATVAASVAPPADAPRASALKQRSAASPRPSTASAPRAPSAKKKAATRRVRRAFGQGLARSR